MSTVMVDEVTPLACASPVNCLFHASKPAAVLPHLAAEETGVAPAEFCEAAPPYATISVFSRAIDLRPGSVKLGAP
jgi:hypothetical protein